jgi:hypothetical protein
LVLLLLLVLVVMNVDGQARHVGSALLNAAAITV